MRIGEIAGVEYRMDEQFQNLISFGDKWFSKLEKIL